MEFPKLGLISTNKSKLELLKSNNPYFFKEGDEENKISRHFF